MMSVTNAAAVLCIGLLFGVPLMALADVQVTNSSSVTNSVSASASSGGQSVSGGESVKTSDSSASVYTEVVSDDEGTEVYVEKTVNGETQVESYREEPGVPVEVSAHAEAKGEGSKNGSEGANSHATGTVEVSASTTAASSATSSASASAFITWSTGLFQGVSQFFGRLFSWL